MENQTHSLRIQNGLTILDGGFVLHSLDTSAVSVVRISAATTRDPQAGPRAETALSPVDLLGLRLEGRAADLAGAAFDLAAAGRVAEHPRTDSRGRAQHRGSAPPACHRDSLLLHTPRGLDAAGARTGQPPTAGIDDERGTADGTQPPVAPLARLSVAGFHVGRVMAGAAQSQAVVDIKHQLGALTPRGQMVGLKPDARRIATLTAGAVAPLHGGRPAPVRGIFGKRLRVHADIVSDGLRDGKMDDLRRRIRAAL